MTVKTTGEMLGIGTHRARKHIDAGIIKARYEEYTDGRRVYLVDHADAVAWFESLPLVCPDVSE